MDTSFKRPTIEPIQFLLLCPSSRTGAIIGKGGSVIRHLQSVSGAKIRVLDDPSIPSDERVVLIVSDSSAAKLSATTTAKNFSAGDNTNSGDAENPSHDKGNDRSELNPNGDCNSREQPLSPGQKALVMVLERIVIGDDAGGCGGEEGGNHEEGKRDCEAICRILVGGNQVGCILGKGGRVVEMIRQESGANIRVLPKDQIPACAFPGDELIQMSGNLSAVKKALLSISSCLQDNPRVDMANSGHTRPSLSVPPGNAMHTQVDPFSPRSYASGLHAMDYQPRGFSSNPGSESIGVHNRMFIEEEIVFKLLCQADKVGSLIGKGGSVIRALQNETGASIKVTDAGFNSDERVVVISARENTEQRHSPAQDAVIRVQTRIAEIGFEPGAAAIARLLVHPQQVGCLLGKGGHIINEMRRATGASIRVFPKEQVQKGGSSHEEVVQVIGSLQCVQDALFHITGRLREALFPMRPSFPTATGPSFLPPFPDMPPPPFRSRHYPVSPRPYTSSAGSFPSIDHSPVPSQSLDHHHQLTFSYGMGPPNFDCVPYSYGSERPVHGLALERPPSPRSWTPQAVRDGTPRGMTDVSSGFGVRNILGSENQAANLPSTTVELSIPQAYLSHVYGENNNNLSQIRQVSGANVTVHDPKPGAAEGIIVVSGTSDQAHAAQSLIHAFILCGQA